MADDKINENFEKDENVKQDKNDNIIENSEELSDSETSSDEDRRIVAYLKVLKQDGQPERIFPIYEGITTIGRMESNDICLNYLGVSSYHAKIEVVCNEHFIEDLHSTNYTHFGDVPIRPSPKMYQLLDKRKISFGRTKCIYEIIPVNEEDSNSIMMEEKETEDMSDETEIEDEIIKDVIEPSRSDITVKLSNLKEKPKIKKENSHDTLNNENNDISTDIKINIDIKKTKEKINDSINLNDKNKDDKENNFNDNNKNNVEERKVMNNNKIQNLNSMKENEMGDMQESNKNNANNENKKGDIKECTSENKMEIVQEEINQINNVNENKNMKESNKTNIDENKNESLKDINDNQNKMDIDDDITLNTEKNKNIHEENREKKVENNAKANTKIRSRRTKKEENEQNNNTFLKDENKANKDVIEKHTQIKENKINKEEKHKEQNEKKLEEKKLKDNIDESKKENEMKNKNKKNNKEEKTKKQNKKIEESTVKKQEEDKNELNPNKTEKNKKKNNKKEENVNNTNNELLQKEITEEKVVEKENKRKRKREETIDNEVNTKTKKNSKVQINDENNSDKPRITFTGIDDHYFEVVKDLGGIVEESWENCTHLVTDKIRRTVKFLCVLATGKQVVSLNWIKASKKAGKFLDPNKYILKDTVSEKKWKFTIKASLEKAQNNRDHPLFDGLTFYMTPNTKPPFHEMETIIHAAGGTLLKNLPKDINDNIIILSCPDDNSVCKSLIKEGYENIHSNEFILSGILRQTVDYTSYKMKIEETKANAATGGRKRKR